MAKYLIQAIVAGTQVVGRAFARALQQEYRASQAAAAARQKSSAEGSRHSATDSYHGMSVQEAKQILNISDLNPEEIQKKYDHLFQVNDKAKGGSFYIQSKVVRAHERIMQEMKSSEEPSENKSTEKSGS